MSRGALTPSVAFAAVVFLIMLPGCATYSRAHSSYRHRQTGLQMELPAGWLQYTPAHPGLTLTRDGLRLECISILVTKCGAKLPGTQRVYRADMLPHELAELSLGLIESSEATKNFQIERVELVPIAGRDGFQADAIFVDEGGLPKRLRVVGFAIGQYVCELRYSAAATAYFEKYEPAFQAVVASIRCTAPK